MADQPIDRESTERLRHANTMQLDETRYREDILTKHRGGRGALRDLFARYAITLPATDADIARQVKEVRAYWKKIYDSRETRLAQVAQLLLAEDERLRAEHGAKMETAAWWQARQSDPQRAAEAEQQLHMPVSVYLSDEAIREQVETAVDQWLITADVYIDTRADPVSGSWFRRMEASAKRAIKTPAAQDALLTAVHVADSHLVQAQDDYVTSTLLLNVGPVLQALQPTKDAVVRAGALLIVKVDWVVQVHQLTAAQQAILDHRPQLAASPSEIVTALRLTEPDSQHGALP
jgi:hypothetical protein